MCAVAGAASLRASGGTPLGLADSVCVGVHSSFGGYAERQAIRETYGRHPKLKVHFFLATRDKKGRTPESSAPDRGEADVVILDMLDVRAGRGAGAGRGLTRACGRAVVRRNGEQDVAHV